MIEELHCYEKAMVNQLNGILKYEHSLNTRLMTKKGKRKAIEEETYINNTRRPHEQCGYKTSVAFCEEALRKTA